ncbi:hypothetical protein CIG75_03295 [Tumebacillus algifaecis]|uniref:alanine--tRNA ligase n=1 Tax=Tumebacillus algifaecis TaxID=1214604 RepID=A0A223CXR5_9BACL|nr:alanine--tRNA ligase-related protein [Tumebacillus algifaecis]ASS74108.1 hypothetical protein CIG75_03295 [Tumebacillus algifaecis]
MKALELRERYADFFLKKGYHSLPEHRVVNTEGDGPHFNGSALTPNLGYFTGAKALEHTHLFTQQRVFWTSYSYTQMPSSLWTIFQVMMSYYQFGQPDLREALTVGWELLTEGLHLPKDDLFVILPQDRLDLQDTMRKIGMPEQNMVLWQYAPRFAIDGLMNGFYCKFFLRHQHAFLPIFDVVNIIGPDGQLKTDSCLLLERMSFILQGKKTWYETEMFLPLMQRLEALEGTKVNDPFGQRVAATVRSLVAALADGAQMTGKGQGHVLKKILRELLHDRYRMGYDSEIVQLVEPGLRCLREIGYDWMADRDRIEAIFAGEEHSYQKVHRESLKFLEKQVKLAENGKRGPFTQEDLDVWKDSRGITVELALDVLRAQGYDVQVAEAKPRQFMTFSDAYDHEENVHDVKGWLLEMEERTLAQARARAQAQAKA